MSAWEITYIGEISDYINRGFSPKYVESDGELIINQKCIRDGRIDILQAKLTDSDKTITPEKKLQKLDILINSTGIGTAGRVGIFKLNLRATADSHVSIVRINKEKADPHFVFYNLRQREADIEGFAEGSTGQIELGRERIKTMDILLPPLPEQRAIAGALSSLDDKIDLLHRQNKTLEEMAETLFRQWFVEPCKDGLPKGWEEGKLGDIITVKYGKDHQKLMDGVIPAYGSGGIMRYVDTALYSKESVLIPRKGTLSNIVYIDEPFWTVDTMFYSEMKILNAAKFVYFFIKSQDIASMNVGSAVPSMTTDVLNNMVISVPSSDILEKFETMASSMFIKKKENQTQIHTLEKLRDTLLPKLMSGEVRVIT